MDFTGQVAIITGAASGIGNACAVAFSKRGGNVVLVDIAEHVHEAAKICRENGRKCIGLQSDVSDLQKQIDVNLKPAVALSKLCADELKKTKLFSPSVLAHDIQGCIVNMASCMATMCSAVGGYYSMTKAALDHFTRCLALELAPHVRVNAVAPGAIDTQMFRVWEGTPYEKDLSHDMICAKTPLGSVGTPQQVAQSVMFLADPKLSSYMTGSTLAVDGGFSLCTF